MKRLYIFRVITSLLYCWSVVQTGALSAAAPKAVAFVGLSNSGKTELICRLLPRLKAQGLRVAVLKHSHHPDPDLGEQGKDTWRYRQAGAQTVALAAPGLLQITYSFSGEPPLEQVLADLAVKADLVLVEGYKTGPLPKVAVLESGVEAASYHGGDLSRLFLSPRGKRSPAERRHGIASSGEVVRAGARSFVPGSRVLHRRGDLGLCRPGIGDTRPGGESEQSAGVCGGIGLRDDSRGLLLHGAAALRRHLPDGGGAGSRYGVSLFRPGD